MTEQSMHYLVEIENQPIELYKLLKIANLVAGGGEAKIVISEGYVYLNDEIETQKRKKVYSGDLIAFNGDFVEVLCHNPPQEQQKKTVVPSESSNTSTMDKSEKSTGRVNTSNKGRTANNKRIGKPNHNKNKKQNTQRKKATSDNAQIQNVGKRRPINF